MSDEVLHQLLGTFDAIEREAAELANRDYDSLKPPPPQGPYEFGWLDVAIACRVEAARATNPRRAAKLQRLAMALERINAVHWCRAVLASGDVLSVTLRLAELVRSHARPDVVIAGAGVVKGSEKIQHAPDRGRPRKLSEGEKRELRAEAESYRAAFKTETGTAPRVVRVIAHLRRCGKFPNLAEIRATTIKRALGEQPSARKLTKTPS